MSRAFAHDLGQGREQRVLRIGAIEPMIPVRATQDQIRRLQLRQFILDRSESEKTQARQLSRIKLLPTIGE